MDETGSQKDAALSLSDGGPLSQVRDPGGLESIPSEVEAS